MLKSTARDAWGFETANVIDGAATAAVESMEHPTMAHELPEDAGDSGTE